MANTPVTIHIECDPDRLIEQITDRMLELGWTPPPPVDGTPAEPGEEPPIGVDPSPGAQS